MRRPLGIVVKGSEGVVLAADSRVTLTIVPQQPNVPGSVQVHWPVNFDNATKLLTFAEPNNWIGAVTFGDAVIGTKASDLRTAHSFVPELEATLPNGRLFVHEFSQHLSNFFLEQWQTKMPANRPSQGMTFIVGGFDKGSVYLLKIPDDPTPEEKTPNDFGMTWGGQQELTARLIRGYDPRIIEIAKKELGINARGPGER